MKQKEDKMPRKERGAKDASPAKEHKEPWQAKYASPAEIQQMVSRRVLLRYNEVRHRTEVHWLSQGPVIREDEQGLLTIFGGDGGVTDGYENLTDRDVNTLWRELCCEKPVVTPMSPPPARLKYAWFVMLIGVALSVVAV